MTQTVLLYVAVKAGTKMQKLVFAELNCYVCSRYLHVLQTHTLLRIAQLRQKKIDNEQER